MGIASSVRDATRSGTAPIPTLEDLWEHHGYLCALTRRIVRDDATAEDVVQETYVRALQRLDELDPDQSIRGWLATVARRVAIDEVRRIGRHAVPVDEVPDRRGPLEHELTDALVYTDTLQEARTAIADLGDRERRLLLRRVADGRSVSDLAEEEGASVRAIESVLTRARAKVAAAMERGAAAFVPGLARLSRWLAERTIDATQPGLEADAATADLTPRSTEMLAAGTAVMVIAASLFAGSGADPATTRVETQGRPDAQPALPMYGTEDADRVATPDRGAAAVSAETLAAALGEMLGVPAQRDGAPTSDEPGAEPAPAAGPNTGKDGWWPRYGDRAGGGAGGGPARSRPPAKDRSPGDPGPGPDLVLPNLAAVPLGAGNQRGVVPEAGSQSAAQPGGSQAVVPVDPTTTTTTTTTVPPSNGAQSNRCASNNTLQSVCDATGWPPPGGGPQNGPGLNPVV